MKSLKPKVAIIGAGIAGLTCANHLAAKDIPSTVFEKSKTAAMRVRRKTTMMGEKSTIATLMRR